MPHIYVNNRSYPELREIGSQREIHRTWRRAIMTAWRDPQLLGFIAIQAVLNVVGPVIIVMAVNRWAAGSGNFGYLVVTIPIAALPVLAAGLIAVTWGGDLMRPHLRRASETARSACPRCGFLLNDHWDRARASDGEIGSIACPECATDVPIGVFEPPYGIPNDCKSVYLGKRRPA